jgi:hypothetical protein
LFDYNIDWTVEPLETFKDLCKEYAQYIRDNYDYVILYYSGGSDSTTILNTFLDNNIKIDEIVTTTFNNVNIPCFDGLYAKNHLKTKGYTGKFTNPVISLSQIIKFMSSDKKLIDAANYTGTINSITRLSVDKLEEYEFTPVKIRKGKIAHVYGYEVPLVVKIDGSYYVQHTLNRELLFRQPGIDVIRFFASKEFPKLYSKQAHMMAKAMKALNINYLPLKIVLKLIRDEYNPIMSPPKSGAMNYINYPNRNSEAMMLYKEYTKDPAFKDLYLNAVLYQQYKIEAKLNTLTVTANKLDLLF